MRRVTASLALALTLSGCGWFAPGDPVYLLTGEPLGTAGCFTSFALGLLLEDPTYGTAIHDENGGGTTPVMWRSGYTGHRVGSEVSVVDLLGNVVATTGQTYKIAGGYVDGDSSQLPTRVFWACDVVIRQ